MPVIYLQYSYEASIHKGLNVILQNKYLLQFLEENELDVSNCILILIDLLFPYYL